LLYVPDIEPGMAIKAIARFSDRISLTVEESSRFFPDHPRKVVTGYPLRPGLNSWTVSEAREFFALKEEMPVLLVLGGSKGARSINQAVSAALPALLAELQVIHITGKLDWQMIEQSRASLTTDQLNRYRPYSYLHEEIGAAFRLADLVITRAGASTLGELPAFGLPAILVPYPYAWRYQRVNASYLVRRGAAIQIEDAQLAAQIAPRVHDLISDKEQLQKMSSAMHSLAKPDAAINIARLLRELAVNSKQTGNQIAPGSTG
jgi:UDP-N-acetylglucosamine--N-acetylmuramyl-(pentapeptide) pyrophosphoryl-undecaprenol N-acetylglucosamine transferase